jgi:predicted dehydrogenase
LPLNHADAIREIEGVDLISICDVDVSTAQIAAERLGVKSVFSDYRQLLDTVRPGIVTVATRTRGRAAIVEEAARMGVRGIHVEKPLCNSLEEGRRAAAVVNLRGTAFSYGTLRRYLSPYRQARDLIESGLLGALRQITINFGPGRLMWTHPHSVDLMQFFAGGSSVEWVSASLAINSGAVAGLTVDDDPVIEQAHVRFASGVHGTITSGGGLNVLLGCERGEVGVMADGRQVQVNRPTSDSGGYYVDQYLNSGPFQREGSAAAIRTIVTAIREGLTAPHSIDQALYGLRVLFAMVMSELAGGRRVSPEDVHPSLTVTGRIGDKYA